MFYWAIGQYHCQTALQTSQTTPDLALFLILVASCDHLATSRHPGIQRHDTSQSTLQKGEPDRIWVLVANNICQNELFAHQ
jgi:hypothetical protein